MSEEQKREPYLLDDEEFSRVMSYQYQIAGKPQDAVTEQRIWQSLANKSKPAAPRWSYALSALAVVAVLLIFVRPQTDDKTLPQETVSKTAESVDKFHVEFTQEQGALRIQVQAKQAQVVTVYASDEQNQRQRLQEPIALQSGEAKAMTLELDSSRNWRRICLLSADNPQELQRMEGTLDIVWNQLTDRQCISR